MRRRANALPPENTLHSKILRRLGVQRLLRDVDQGRPTQRHFRVDLRPDEAVFDRVAEVLIDSSQARRADVAIQVLELLDGRGAARTGRSKEAVGVRAPTLRPLMHVSGGSRPLERVTVSLFMASSSSATGSATSTHVAPAAFFHEKP